MSLRRVSAVADVDDDVDKMVIAFLLYDSLSEDAGSP